MMIEVKQLFHEVPPANRKMPDMKSLARQRRGCQLAPESRENERSCCCEERFEIDPAWISGRVAFFFF